MNFMLLISGIWMESLSFFGLMGCHQINLGMHINGSGKLIELLAS